jgi:hypothetical protein
MSTDHGPMPRTGKSSRATASSSAVSSPRAVTRRSPKCAARSSSARALASDRPALRSRGSGVAASAAGRGNRLRGYSAQTRPRIAARLCHAACYTRASMLAYALVIGSALLHASWNALVKRTRDPAASVHTVVATAGALTAIAAAGEYAVTGRGGSGTALGLAAIAGVLEAGYFHALGRALTLGPLGPVYTISRGGAALLVWPASMLAFGERLTPLGGGDAR